MGVNYRSTVNGVKFYEDSESEKDKVIVMRKSNKEVPTGMIYMPNWPQEVWDKAWENSKLPTMEEREEWSRTSVKYDVESHTITAIIPEGLTDEQWEDFRNLFEQVHKGFCGGVKKQYPKIFKRKKMNKYCCNCWKPAEGEEIYCSFCDSDKFGEINNEKCQYSVLQWEHFIGKHGPVGTHDFSPWEFDESGHITRGAGTQGSSGPSGTGDQNKTKTKQLHSKKNAYRK